MKNKKPQKLKIKSAPMQTETSKRSKTVRGKVNGTLQEKAEFYRQIFDLSPFGIGIATLNGRVVTCNRTMQNITGYTAAELSEIKLSDTYEKKEDRKALFEIINRNGYAIDFPVRLKHKNGTPYDALLNVSKIRLGDKEFFQTICQDIAERKRAEELIHQSEAELKAVQSIAHVGSWRWDIKNNKLTWSDEMYRIFGIPKEKFTGILEDVMTQAIHPDDRPAVEATNISVIRDKKPIPLEYRVIWPDKSIHVVWAEAGEFILDENGAPSVLTGIVLDITERKQAQDKLRQRSEDLSIVNAINTAANRGESLIKICAILAEQTKQIFYGYSATVYLLSEDQKQLVMLGSFLPPTIEKQIKNLIGTSIPLMKLPMESTSIYQQTLKDGKPRIIHDPAEIQALLNEFVNAYSLPVTVRAGIKKLVPQIQKILKIRSVVIVPLLLEGKTIGVLDMSSTGNITESDIERLSTIAEQLTAAIIRIQAHDEIERLGYQNQLILNSAGEGILGIGKEGRHIFVNPKAASMLGYQIDELIGRESHSIWHHTKPDGNSYPEEECMICNTYRDGIVRNVSDELFWRKDGTSFPVECSSNPIYENSQLVGAVVTFMDLTERKQAEQAMAESETKFRWLYEYAPIVYHILTPKGLIMDVNRRWCQVLGYSKEEVLGKEIFDFIVEEERKAARASFIKKKADKRTFLEGSERNYLTKAGVVRTFKTHDFLVVDQSQNITSIQTTLEDITERKLAEKSLLIMSDTQRRLSQLDNLNNVYKLVGSKIQELTKDSYVVVTELDEKIQATRMKEMFGFGKTYQNLVHLFKVDPAHFVYYLKDMTVEQLRSFRSGKLEKIKGGLYQMLLHKVPEPICNAAEKKLKCEGIYTIGFVWQGLHFGSLTILARRDITSFKETIEIIMQQASITINRIKTGLALQESEERFRGLYENATIGMYQTTPDGHILMANPALVKMLGFQSFEELAKRNLNQEGVEAAETRQKFQHRIEEDGKVQGYKSAWKRKDGLTIYVQESARVMRDENENVLYYEGTVENISEHHIAEKALQESEERYHGLFEDSPVSLWEENFSAVKQRLDTLRAQGVTDMRAYLESHPQEVADCAALAKVIDVNKASLELFKAKKKDDLLGNLSKILSPQYLEDFRKELVNIAEGKTKFNWESVDQTLTGEHIDVSLSWSVLPGHEGDLSKTVLSITDITDRKLAEKEMRRLINDLHKLSEKEKKDRIFAEALAKNVISIKSTLNTDEILDSILNTINNVVPADAISIMRIEGEHARIVRARGYQERGLTDWVKRRQFKLDEIKTLREIVRSKKFKITSNTDKSQDWTVIAETAWIKSNIISPIIENNTVIGFVNVDSTTPDFYTEEHAQHLEVFTDQVSTALKNAHQFEATQRRMNRMQAMTQIDQAINSSLDLNVSMEIVLSNAKDQLSADAVDILLVDDVTNSLVFSKAKGFKTDEIRKSNLRLGNGLPGRAVLERTTVAIPDLNSVAESYFKNLLVEREGFVSYFCVPLITKGQLKGVMEVYFRHTFQADQEWLEFLEMLTQQTAIAINNAELLNSLQSSNIQLLNVYETTLKGWVDALDMRDHETEGHTQRVTELSLKLANLMGIKDKEIVNFQRGALLHDIGKVAVSDAILNKPGPLTEEEWVIMRKHPLHAYSLLSKSKYLVPALDIPYCHHEKWDGSGYPRGLKGEAIPLAARIFAIVGVWDALISDRPYRKAWTKKKALEYIQEQSGKHFDPDVVKVFLNNPSVQKIGDF